MAEQVLNGFNVSAGGNGYCCGGMPQIVRPRVWPANAGRYSLEMFIERHNGDMFSKAVRKDEVVRVAP